MSCFGSDLAHATSVDAAGAFVDAARTEAERQGHANRMSLYQGDFVMLASDIATADIVTLDRVICCYPDMPALVDSSVAHARHRLRAGLSARYMGDPTWSAVAQLVLPGSPAFLPTFVHSTESVNPIVVAQGFQSGFNS